jgi:diguanylate cyclase (GGDEF)-like protein/PAS domain S-box-containing protein
MEDPRLAQQLEASRLTSLLSMGVLDTPAQSEFDELTRLAALACGTASAAVTLIDADRAWFKSRVCLDVPEVPRDWALCSLEIADGQFLCIPDTWRDERCAGNPLTVGPDAIRFYAGAPLLSSTGHCVGRLCVFDGEPREALADSARDALTAIAQIVADLLDARHYRHIGRIAAQVVDVTSDAILCADARGRITFWNAAAEVMFGHPANQALGAPLELIMPSDLKAAHATGFAQAAKGAFMKLAGKSVELTAVKADGTHFPIELSLGRWQDGDAPGFAAIIRDASSRKLLEREREQARMFLDTVIENLPAMLFVKDAESQRYLLMNKAGAEIAGRPQEDFPGRTDSELFPGLGEGYEARDRAAAEIPGVHIYESEHVRADGQRVSLRTKRLVIDAPLDKGRYLLGMSEDVTEARLAQAEVQRLAEYDALTGLRNRAGFVTRIDELAAAGTPFTMLGVDLDRFKAVNDQFGHLIGDEVLSRIGRRLSDLASRGDLIARLGGDEFMIVLVGDDAVHRAADLSPAIIAAIEEPVSTDRVRAFVGASIGVASYPADGATATEVRQATDLALYRAKENGRGTTCFYNEAIDAALRDRRQLEHALRQAVDEDGIEVVFQPVFSVQTGLTTSFEALARWRHPLRGPIAPADFIALAEECGLIEALGKMILCKACNEAARWPAQVRVAVNLSPLQFQTGKLCETVSQILDETGLPPQRLQLEVTEGLLIRDVDRTFSQLEQLRALGIQILMDDFGVGYSSLSYFQRFPFDKVKIDRSFVESAPEAPAAQAIIRAVVQLGETLNMGVVAEGVETPAQMDLLASFGCTHVQGYLLGRPMPRQEIAGFLARQTQPSESRTQAA